MLGAGFTTHPTRLELSYLVDGELRPSDARQARRHLESCVRCAALYRRCAEPGRRAPRKA